jgi:hypothetical protein
VPGEHKLAEHGVHVETPLVKEKFEPAVQGMHTLSNVVVQFV